MNANSHFACFFCASVADARDGPEKQAYHADTKRLDGRGRVSMNVNANSHFSQAGDGSCLSE